MALQFWVFFIIINTIRLAFLSESLSHPFQMSRRYSHTQGKLFSVSDFPVGKRNVHQADYFTFPPSCQRKPPRPANSSPARLAVLGSQPGEAELLRPPPSLWSQRSPFYRGCRPADHNPGSSEDRNNLSLCGSWRLASPILAVILSSPGITQVPAPRVIYLFYSHAPYCSVGLSHGFQTPLLFQCRLLPLGCAGSLFHCLRSLLCPQESSMDANPR